VSRIDVGGLRFEGLWQEETVGVVYFSDLTDWYSGAKSKTETREIPESDGAWEQARDWRGSLPISVKGWYRAPTEFDLFEMIARMRGALVPRTLVDMTVTDALRPSSRRVSVRNLWIKEDLESKSFDFELDVTANDPTLFGPEDVVTTTLPTFGGGLPFPIEYPLDLGTAGDPGTLEVVNPGPTDAFTQFEVYGGGMVGGFEILNMETGRRLRCERSLSSGHTAYFASRTAAAYLDDPANDISAYLTVREWWVAPPQSSQTIRFDALGTTSGTPRLRARTRPTY